MNRYVFIGSVEYSTFCLKTLLEMGINIVSIMCPYREVSKFNSDYCDLAGVAKEFGKDVYYFKRIQDETEHIKDKKPDIIFVLGLSQIVPKEILNIPALGCIGSHPTLLPKNRGRHPIIWAIANGLKESGITLFWMDEGVDSGDIWKQKRFAIIDKDDASTVYAKTKELAVKMLKEGIPEIEKGIVKRVKQDHSATNYWRKRTKKDGEIDWRMSSKRIYDLVRALTKPYVGAHCLYKDKEIKIWKTKILDSNKDFDNFEPGKVIAVNDLYITVKTGNGLLEIIEHEFDSLPAVDEYL